MWCVYGRRLRGFVFLVSLEMFVFYVWGGSSKENVELKVLYRRKERIFRVDW